MDRGEEEGEDAVRDFFVEEILVFEQIVNLQRSCRANNEDITFKIWTERTSGQTIDIPINIEYHLAISGKCEDKRRDTRVCSQ